MNIFSKKILFNVNFLYLTLIFLFSFSINFYYAKLGSFPVDTFFHYGSAYNILKNEIPIKDFWIVSGLIVDIFQYSFFKILGVNWFAYTVHSSIFNFFISLFSYYFFLSLNLSKLNAFIYTFSVATLAYTISGTPFVEQHATFFLLISTYLIIFTFRFKEKNYIWIFIVALVFLSFLSKQVPAAYVILSQGIILLYYFIKMRKKEPLKVIFLSTISFVLFFVFIFIYLKIDLYSFYVQYIDYPRSVGLERYSQFTKSFEIFFNQYKFLLLPIILISIFKIKKIKDRKINFSSQEMIIFLIFLAFSISILFHQLMTKNQIFIYFLIPIFLALLESELRTSHINYKKHFSAILILLSIFITLKYHLRFNETRKFHELERVDLNNSISASEIDKSLNGLKWINPLFKGDPSKEVLMLKQTKERIDKIDYEIMLITNYLFLDSITKKNLNSPSRIFTSDGTSIPLKSNRYYNYYKKFLINKIQKKNIREIYFLKLENLPKEIITDYIDKTCVNLIEDKLFYIFKMNCLK